MKKNNKEKKKLIKEGWTHINKLSYQLNRHTQRNLNTNHINYKIQHLLYDPFTFINAYAKISKNKGALTEGHMDEQIIQLFGHNKAESIAKKIKENNYQFKTVKRTWIPKPGKKKKRPIDVPTQSDRIVQEAIRGILEAIYEPIFQEHGKTTKNLNNNYGFRPQQSCWSAIEKLKLHSKGCNLIIEGDIVSAYNNVNHNILLKILQKRIKDKRFLNLIRNMLKSGIMDDKRYEHSLNGTPQGGIVSPLLFNIYMFELDKYIYEEFIIPVLNQNKKKQKINKSRSLEYNQIKYNVEKALKQHRKTKENCRLHPSYVTKSEKKRTKKILKKQILTRLKTPYGRINNLKKGAVYVRYADDWVLAMTCTKKEAIIAKEKIANFLNNYLKMKLDDDKTKITFASDGYKFLGFEIRLNIKNPKLKRVLLKNTNGKYIRTLKRTTSRQLTIELDSDRILKRLIALKMCNKQYMPKGKPIWRSYNEFQIVQKYAQIMRGIYNYYKPCERLSRLYHVSYILQYSCAKTIAGRKRKSLPQVFKQYGLNLRITETIKNPKGETKNKVQNFLDIVTLKKIDSKKAPNENFQTDVSSDPFRIREFWRTKFKFYNECCICGSKDDIQLHHINSIRSLKNKDNASAIRSQLNRLQIPVCHTCHKDITHGKFNDPKKPIEFYNEFIAKL
jgi:retron-type reverse transcriptase